MLDFESSYLIASLRDSTFVTINKQKGNLHEFVADNNQIAGVCNGDGWAIVAIKDTLIRVIGRETRPIFLYLCEVSCVDFNPTFDTIAVANKRGDVVLCYLSNGEVSQSLKMKQRRSVRIHITKSWGIIVIESVEKYGTRSWIS
jgi:hypothetical protein